MSYQREYEEFVEKFFAAIRAIEDDMDALSPESKQRFLENANSLLRDRGYAITLGEVKWPYFG